MYNETDQNAYNMLKTMRLWVKDVFAKDLVAKTVEAGTDAGKQRELACDTATYQYLSDAKPWSEGMTTNPGDVVFDPEGKYRYIFTGSEPMTHSNPLFYPGAAGVYYWAIIPRLKDFIKVYPDIEGIIVSVKQGEIWWNTDETAQYCFIAQDNASCVWAPSDEEETLWERVLKDEEG